MFRFSHLGNSRDTLLQTEFGMAHSLICNWCPSNRFLVHKSRVKPCYPRRYIVMHNFHRVRDYRSSRLCCTPVHTTHTTSHHQMELNHIMRTDVIMPTSKSTSIGSALPVHLLPKVSLILKNGREEHKIRHCCTPPILRST